MWTELVLSVCVLITLMMSLALCLCWRKKSTKSDWIGLDGMVTQKNPDENVNHLPSAAPCVVDGMSPSAANVDPNDSSKRNVASTNTRRSLPDIPMEQGAIVNWEPTGDNSSEHYATVGQYQNAKRHTLPNGIDARPSISQHSSISQADDSSFSPYEKVKYDKIKSQEHPYAQLQPTNGSRLVVSEQQNHVSEERLSLLRVDGPSTSAEPSIPSRSRRSSSHSGLAVDIPAASAVAGGIAASPELPYMTPPVNQSNFSGDSQDSSKGYTSISVREPLANIIAQTKAMGKKRDLDQHYSTVSDDSDDVYTTIPDPNNQIYTSESETYARIPALPITVEAEVNPAPSRRLEDEDNDNDDEEGDELYEPPPHPPPPSVDSLKQVASHTHSRQASSSSSIANVGSPKPEKRQANSPLPPPPTASSFDFHSDKVQLQRNVDDLYAKVHKTKRKDNDSDGERSPDKGAGPSSAVFGDTRTSSSSLHSVEEKKFFEPDGKKRKEHNYETLKKLTRGGCGDPGYEKIRHEEPGYASINGPDSIASSDPGYEVLKHNSPPSDVDPNYEELQDRGPSAVTDAAGYSKIRYNNLVVDGYSVVNKQRKSDDKSRTSSSYDSHSQDLSLDEPNYESMPSESLSEHNYACLKSTDSESDPNYESVSQLDYESVKTSFKRLGDDDSTSRTDSELLGYETVMGRGYENIDTSEGSNGRVTPRKSDPPYEKLNYDTDSDIPGYERVKRVVAKSNNSSSLDSSSSTSGRSTDPSSSNSKQSDRSSNLLEEDADAIFQV